MRRFERGVSGALTVFGLAWKPKLQIETREGSPTGEQIQLPSSPEVSPTGEMSHT